MLTKEIVQQAYKKLKAEVFYDKTMPIMRNDIVSFENGFLSCSNLDKYLDSIYELLCDDKKFDGLVKDILTNIKYIALPKKVKGLNETTDVIFNFVQSKNVVDSSDVQYFIDMPILGHLLGVLWVMLIGSKLDKKLYKHLYGNRISKFLRKSNKEFTFSPYLFEPYFIQYESWRDQGLKCAEDLIATQENVFIITLDLQRYYYSLDVDDKVMSAIYAECCESISEDEAVMCKRLNDFVGKVISAYASNFGKKFRSRKILPIGFLPSNIIGNWCLRKFDQKILDDWNPAYYGRYVDDILIVDKVSDKSSIGGIMSSGNRDKKKIIESYLGSWVDIEKSSVDGERNYITDNNNNCISYKIKSKYNPTRRNKSTLKFNLDKTKMFYFDYSQSTALIKCFKNKIAKNKSEFRHMPDDEDVLKKDDYSVIYNLVSAESINKLREVDGIEIDRLELSKFLGKYLRICAMIDDKRESKFEQDILKIFNERIILQNYTQWEKVIEILTINEHFSTLEVFCDRIMKAIDSIQMDDIDNQDEIKDSFFRWLYAVICRNLALVWKEECSKLQQCIINMFSKYGVVYDRQETSDIIYGYCKSRLMDKSLLPIFYDMLNMEKIKEQNNVNLTRLSEVLSCISSDAWQKDWKIEYKYYPYLINIADCCFANNLAYVKGILDKPVDDIGNVSKNYFKINYNSKDETKTLPNIDVSWRDCNKDKEKKKWLCAVSVGEETKEKLKIAIANITLKETDVQAIFKKTPSRSLSRYKRMTKIVNEALDSQADILIMPEAYVPYEWLPVLYTVARKQQMAIITGVEHIIVDNNVFNMTAVMLPYIYQDHKDVYVHFHVKNHYAPDEMKKINGYGYSYKPGVGYELYKWRNCYFSVYCCFELTSIAERALFQSYADLIIAVEWNKDIKYYSNIAESLSRDMHCYFAQVNSANYGDSRIVRPTKSEQKDLIRTKGGINASVLVDEIDVKSLREFQIKDYVLQSMDLKFKYTPPNFDKKIVWQKIKNEKVDLFRGNK